MTGLHVTGGRKTPTPRGLRASECQAETTPQAGRCSRVTEASDMRADATASPRLQTRREERPSRGQRSSDMAVDRQQCPSMLRVLTDVAGTKSLGPEETHSDVLRGQGSRSL